VGHSEQPLAAGNADDDAKIAAASRLVREAVGVPPVVRWRHRGEPPVLAESYLFPSRAKVALPKFAVPIIGIQLDGRKMTFDKDMPPGGAGVFPYSIPNRCVLIPPDTESYWTPGPGNMTLSGIYVGGKGEEAIRRILGDSREPVMLRDTIVVALARQMLGLATDRRPAVDEYGARLVNYLVAHLDWLSNAPLATRPVRNTTYDATMSGILSLIESNIEQALTIDMLAAKAGMSPALFRKRFTDTTGVPVHSYILKERIERACELIDECNLPLAAIAAQCGFSSQSHMTKIFRRELGVTPAERRRADDDAGKSGPAQDSAP
jgi:AraC family transcriptional regulator